MRIFSTSADNQSLGHYFRQQRMIFFKACLEQLPKPVKILDAGGFEAFWVNADLHNSNDLQVSILNLEMPEINFPNLRGLIGDGCHMPQFDDSEFDIVFSNSVIEHVYTWENQQKMAKELVRIGKYHFIQTPNKHFAVEPHYLLPFFQYLPKSWKYQVLTKTPLSRMHKWEPKFAKQYVDEIRLISLKEYQKLFPDSEMWHEKVFGLSKSFVAHNFR